MRLPICQPQRSFYQRGEPKYGGALAPTPIITRFRATSVCKEPAGSLELFRGTRGMRSKLGRGDRVQDSAHVGGALRSERFLELPLCLHPSFYPRPKTGFAGLGDP